MALTAFQERKLTALFRVLDIDRDGGLGQADHVVLLNNLAAVRGWALGTPEYEGFVNRMAFVWSELATNADRSGKGSVSLEDWLAYNDELLSGRLEANAVLTAATTILEAIDKNGDGQISLPEYKLFFHVYGISPDGVDAIFAGLDLDGDGFISHAEMRRHCMDFWTSDDPTKPGNRVFGKF